MKKLFFFSLLAIVFWACCPDETPMPTPEPDYYAPHLLEIKDTQLIDMPPRGSIPGVNIMRGTMYFSPFFNPNNPYEIAYAQGDSATSPFDYGIYKFNFKTGKKTLLVPKAYQLSDWGENGWLLYTGYDAQVWKVKENGDSATRLTNNSDFGLSAKWSPNQQYFAYSVGQQVKIARYNGEAVKSIRKFANALCWMNDTMLSYDNYANIFSLNINTEISNIIRNFGDVGVTTWQSPQKVSYVAKDRGNGYRGFFAKYDYNTGQTDTIRQLYNSYIYGIGDYDYINHKLIGVVQRSTWVANNNPHRYAWLDLILIDAKTYDEKIIRIPD
jgi:hypothetical protein